MQITTNEKRATDLQLERLAREIGELIGTAQPEEREQLRQMASDLIRDQTSSSQMSPARDPGAVQRPLNVVALGGVLLAIGAVLAVFLPPIGVLLIGGGLATVILAFLYNAVTK